MEIIIFILVSYLLLSVSLYFLFPKAGEAGWKGLVPGYNFAIMAKLVGRSPNYAWWFLFPIVNLFIYAYLCIEMVRSFKKYSFLHAVIAVVYAPAFFFYLAFSKDENYDGPTLTREKEYHAQLVEAHEKEIRANCKNYRPRIPIKNLLSGNGRKPSFSLFLQRLSSGCFSSKPM
ncbi:MAG: hypothetical protein IPJ40_24110 [Saprospirales bacterium]|nr:hypothetical protein [Saprospirales bacterium]